MMQISEPGQSRGFALFNLGFRPFFLGAALFATLAILIWTSISTLHIPLSPSTMPSLLWHAHEMIYGYALAVVAGFLLTSVRNWTGLATPSGSSLALLFAIWAGARITPALPFDNALWLMAVLDLLFLLGLIISILLPIVQARSWRQLAIVGTLLLLWLTNCNFYLSALGFDGGLSTRQSIHSALYLIIGLVLILGRRVIPFFIERGIGYPVSLRNPVWIDRISLPLYIAFWLGSVVLPDSLITALLASALAVIHALRLAGWYTAGIMRKPMLWILYLGYACLVLGFALHASSYFFATSIFLGIHAFAYGGIGMITLGMMARVALGHTGRDVYQPPRALALLFVVLGLGAACRIVLPLAAPQLYWLWIALSQAGWLIAFGGFAWLYLPMLVSPRVDGRPG